MSRKDIKGKKKGNKPEVEATDDEDLEPVWVAPDDEADGAGEPDWNGDIEGQWTGDPEADWSDDDDFDIADDDFDEDFGDVDDEYEEAAAPYQDGMSLKDIEGDGQGDDADDLEEDFADVFADDDLDDLDDLDGLDDIGGDDLEEDSKEDELLADDDSDEDFADVFADDELDDFEGLDDLAEDDFDEFDDELSADEEADLDAKGEADDFADDDFEIGDDDFETEFGEDERDMEAYPAGEGDGFEAGEATYAAGDEFDDEDDFEDDIFSEDEFDDEDEFGASPDIGDDDVDSYAATAAASAGNRAMMSKVITYGGGSIVAILFAFGIYTTMFSGDESTDVPAPEDVAVNVPDDGDIVTGDNGSDTPIEVAVNEPDDLSNDDRMANIFGNNDVVEPEPELEPESESESEPEPLEVAVVNLPPVVEEPAIAVVPEPEPEPLDDDFFNGFPDFSEIPVEPVEVIEPVEVAVSIPDEPEIIVAEPPVAVDNMAGFSPNAEYSEFTPMQPPPVIAETVDIVNLSPQNDVVVDDSAAIALAEAEADLAAANAALAAREQEIADAMAQIAMLEAETNAEAGAEAETVEVAAVDTAVAPIELASLPEVEPEPANRHVPPVVPPVVDNEPAASSAVTTTTAITTRRSSGRRMIPAPPRKPTQVFRASVRREVPSPRTPVETSHEYYILQGVANGRAWMRQASTGDLVGVIAGDDLPGYGRVIDIRRGFVGWEIVAERGIIRE